MQLKGKLYISILIVTMFISSCLTGGTHGSLKSYSFPLKKRDLQENVISIINENHNINIAPITDTFTSGYYNDGSRYITINVIEAKDTCEYTFQFSGDEKYWDTSNVSHISIAYMFDQNGNGGSETNNTFHWYSPRLKNRLLKVFENNIIDPIKMKIKNIR
jgi:hypothetical protein